MLTGLNICLAILYVVMSCLSFYIEIVKWKRRKQVGDKEIWYEEWNIRAIAFPIWAAAMCYLLSFIDFAYRPLSRNCMETTLVLGFIYGSLYVFFNLRRVINGRIKNEHDGSHHHPWDQDR
ncbi:hypothetical protein [Dictyobacter kobayashii]|uniref:hypothetical protein n=1 Tax=Dictyobacter kobayashii TaxID=2014872 RepID=UPI000F84767E|nr:hypothetical protein [Dictyobacter kobayashii]